MKANELYTKIMTGDADDFLLEVCAVSPKKLAGRRTRIGNAIKEFTDLYGNREVMLFSVGGRSEISGNHTDHNRGKVLCAAIDLDIIAIASPTDDGVVSVKSEGFDADIVEPSEIMEPNERKYFTSESIIAGMERAFVDKGYNIGGFVAYTTSNVFKGSGLSSSAAFEVMIGNIINHLYNEGKVDNVEIAKMAQFAENEYFGKPCGLMDQTACAVGGFISIDFENTDAPIIEKIDFDMNEAGYSLCIIDTGGNHADLNEDYASVPAEMKGVAKVFGHSVLRQCTKEELLERADTVRALEGDRAFLRAMHFFNENERVEKQTAALKEGNIKAFFKGVLKSGRSSFCYLQNVYTTKNVREQGLSLALCMTEDYLSGKVAAWRVHGGGFAGTVQAFVPNDIVRDYKEYMEKVFGKDNCHILSIRSGGAVRIM